MKIDRYSNLFPSEKERKAQRLSTREKKRFKKDKPPICEISAQEYEPRFRHIHHILPVETGGTKDPSNLMQLGEDVHNKLHALVYELVRKNWWEFEGRTKKEKRAAATAYYTETLSREFREWTRLVRIDLGEAPEEVYWEVFREG